MKPLYTKEEYDNAKSMDKLPCECYHCKTTIYSIKKLIKQELKENRGRIKYCSNICLGYDKRLRTVVN